jgi:hypothetical protein
MCSRTCPCCGSTHHYAGYGLAGTTLTCMRCFAVLACRRDIEAAPLGMTEEEAEAWAARGSGVMEGAEASDPLEDEVFGPNRYPAPFLAF